MSNIHEGSMIVWLAHDWLSEGAMSGDTKRVLNSIHLNTHEGMESAGWVRLGTAEVKVTLIDKEKMVENKIESLKAEKTKTLADAQMKATEIEEKIQKLLAIGFDAPTVIDNEDDLPF